MCKIDPAACRVDMQRCAFRIFKADLAAGGSNFQRVALIICDLRLAVSIEPPLSFLMLSRVTAPLAVPSDNVPHEVSLRVMSPLAACAESAPHSAQQAMSPLALCREAVSKV